MVSPEIGRSNKELKMELWERGYYVIEIGCDSVDYLVVSTAPPTDLVVNENTIDHTSN